MQMFVNRNDYFKFTNEDIHDRIIHSREFCAAALKEAIGAQMAHCYSMHL